MENTRVIRRVLAFGLVLAVQGGAVCAPFLHAHLDADHDDHHSTAVHAHVSSHAAARVQHPGLPTGGVSVEEAHREAIDLQIFVAVEATPFHPPALPRGAFATAPIVERAPRTFVIVTHGHDPPLVDALDSRPPPLTFLS
jgi:hypothetical protein